MEAAASAAAVSPAKSEPNAKIKNTNLKIFKVHCNHNYLD